jgi:hypothetical protein
MSEPAFCIFIDTICEGRIPAWHDENRMPVVYPTLEAAQREIADDVMEKLRQFLAWLSQARDQAGKQPRLLEKETGWQQNPRPGGESRLAAGGVEGHSNLGTRVKQMRIAELTESCSGFRGHRVKNL